MHCDLLEIYCVPPNLSIRARICRINYAQRPIYLDLTFFKEPEISDSGPQLKFPPGGFVLRIFKTWKTHRPQSDLNSRTLDLEASTLSRDHRDRQLPTLIPKDSLHRKKLQFSTLRGIEPESAASYAVKCECGSVCMTLQWVLLTQHGNPAFYHVQYKYPQHVGTSCTRKLDEFLITSLLYVQAEGASDSKSLTANCL